MDPSWYSLAFPIMVHHAAEIFVSFMVVLLFAVHDQILIISTDELTGRIIFLFRNVVMLYFIMQCHTSHYRNHVGFTVSLGPLWLYCV